MLVDHLDLHSVGIILYFLQYTFKVSKKELFQTDMTTLLALCEKTENDIRSCLNTLQV